jgi:lysylphosphatidylglycerol synthase-like protein
VTSRARRSPLLKRIVLLSATGVSLYLVAPSLIELFASSPQVAKLKPGWLVFALAAVGAEPRPSLVLLAFTGSQLLTLVPLTPGGLGFVEAGLAGLLVLAGVSAADAALATLAYRLVSYWPPLPARVLWRCSCTGVPSAIEPPRAERPGRGSRAVSGHGPRLRVSGDYT